MSNLGLHKFCEEHHLKLLCAAVGDRNVLELMQKEHMVLGGEQSGHIIFLEHMTTGDGQLAALQFLSILGQSGKKASELAGQITHYPQLLQNVKVGSNEEKTAILNSRELAQATAREEVRLTGARTDFAACIRHGAAHSCHGRGGYTRSCGKRGKNAGGSRRKHTKNPK